jgi:hypothetical protein
MRCSPLPLPTSSSRCSSSSKSCSHRDGTRRWLQCSLLQPKAKATLLLLLLLLFLVPRAPRNCSSSRYNKPKALKALVQLLRRLATALTLVQASSCLLRAQDGNLQPLEEQELTASHVSLTRSLGAARDLRMVVCCFAAINALYKTEICRSHMQTGFCSYADTCQFAHGMHEV